MIDTYIKLTDKVMKAVDDRCDNRQYWICLAGGPGAGKSTLSAAVVKRLNELSGSPDYSVVLPMDGFHYSRAELKRISEQPGSPSFDELLARRGSPWTFDASGVCAALLKARTLRSGRHSAESLFKLKSWYAAINLDWNNQLHETIGSLPTYSRAISDPVPGGVELLEVHKVVIVEGNYMLNYDDPLWSPLRDLFDEKVFPILCASH
jgi:pantothenate kinase